MHLGLVLEMVHSGYGSRTAVTVGHTSLDYAALAERSWAATGYIRQLAVPSVVYIGGNDLAYPVSLFGVAGVGVPFIPLNYRLGTEQLTAQARGPSRFAHPSR